MKLRDFSFYLSSTFIYVLILIKIYMNANIINTRIFHNNNKFDLKGHWRSLTLNLVLSLPSFLLLSLYIPLYLPILLQANIYLYRSMILKVTWGHLNVPWFLKILRSFDQITTLTYVLMDNFCPCFSHT